MSQEVYLIDGIRSAIGSFGGSLAPLRADDLAAQVLAGLLKRQSQLDPKSIEDVLLGCANQAGEDGSFWTRRPNVRLELWLAFY